MRKLLTIILTLTIITAFSHAPFVGPRTASAATLQKAPNNLGLVGYWPMDENRGTAAGDASGNGNTGAITGATWTDGKRGKALDFGGSSQYVDMSTITGLLPTQEITISAWFKADAIDCEWNPVVEGGGNLNTGTGYYFGFYSCSSDFYMMVGDGTYVSSAVTLQTGRWYHAVGVFSGISGINKLYIDGVVADSDNHAKTSISYNVNSVSIGRLNYCCTASHQFDGKIDDVRIYSRALSATDVTSLYRSGQVTRKAVSESGLVGYWPVDEDRGVTAGDASGNGNTGAITGAAWTNGKRGKALSFNGTTSNVVIPYNASMAISNNAETVAAWVKHNNSTYMIFQSAGWNRRLFGSVWTFIDSSVNYYNLSVAGSTDNNWHHVAYTVSGKTVTTYVDGRLVDTVTMADFLAAPTGDWWLGRVCAGASCDLFYTGLLDDVRIYNRALSASEILNLYKQNETIVNANTNSRITDGLVGAWSFNGNNLNMASTTAEILDVSGQGNHGDNSGGRADAGRIGQGWYCTTDDQVNLPDISAAGASGSYTLWIKPDSNNVSQGWIDSTYDIFQWSGSALYFRAGNQSLVSISTWQPNEWHHVAMTWNGSNYFGYIDGVQVTSGTQTGSRSGSLYLCRVDGGYYYSGGIDEVRVYNRALSSSEVLQLYNMGK